MHPIQPEKSEFASVLAAIQERTGLSDQAVARVAGVDRSQVWRWGKAGANPGYEPVRRLAAWLAAERPEVAAEAAALLPAAGYEPPSAAVPPVRPRRHLKALEDADEPGLAPYLQAVRREVYAAADVLAMFPPGDLPGPETIPEIAPLLDVLPGEEAFPDSPTEPAVWDMRDRLTVAERIRLIARLRRMTAEAAPARDRRASG